MTSKKTCKYPGCNDYNKKAEYYCCKVCEWDHKEDEMLIKEEKELEETRKKLSKCALDHAKKGELNYGLTLDKKTLKGLAYYIKWHMTESTTLNEAINEMMQDYAENLEDEPARTVGDIR